MALIHYGFWPNFSWEAVAGLHIAVAVIGPQDNSINALLSFMENFLKKIQKKFTDPFKSLKVVVKIRKWFSPIFYGFKVGGPP